MFFYDDFIEIIEESKEAKAAGAIAESLLDVTIVPADEYSSDEEDLTFTWNMTYAKGRVIHLNLTFTNPHLVSSGRGFDILLLKFNSDYTFLDKHFNSIEPE